MLRDIIFPLTPYHWLVLGLLLLIAEALGAAGFLLGAAVAAFAVGEALLVVDFHWQWQLGGFAILAVVCTALYWRRFRGFNRKRTDHELLNKRAAQLIGRRITLDAPLRNGMGKLRIGDTLWSVRTDASDLEPEAVVEVVGAEGMTLLVEPLEHNAA